MTGYEIIKANVHFNSPERIGLRFDRIGHKGDVYRIFVLPPRDKRNNEVPCSVKKKVRPKNGEYDEWGCLWQSDDETGSDMGQVTNVPISDWEEDFENYVFPGSKSRRKI